MSFSKQPKPHLASATGSSRRAVRETGYAASRGRAMPLTFRASLFNTVVLCMSQLSGLICGSLGADTGIIYVPLLMPQRC